MSYRDCVGLTRVQQEEEDAREAARMYPLTPGDGPTPYYLPGQCPLDAIEDVARGLRPESTVTFLLKRHIVQVGDLEWSLDGDLSLWREARIYAAHLRGLGLLTSWYSHNGIEYGRQRSGAGG